MISACVGGSFPGNPECELTALEEEVLKKILDQIPEEKRNPEQLQFRSGRANPGFFEIDGNIRIAKTYDEIGSPVYINSDFLNPVDVYGVGQPMTITSAAAVLVHELGHHVEQPVPLDHVVLDIIGAKVKRAANFRVWQMEIDEMILPVSSSQTQWTLVTVNGPGMFPTKSSRTFIIGPENFYELTDMIIDQVNCPSSTLRPIADSYSLFDPAWSRWQLADGHLRLILGATGDLFCYSRLQPDFIVLDSCHNIGLSLHFSVDHSYKLTFLSERFNAWSGRYRP